VDVDATEQMNAVIQKGKKEDETQRQRTTHHYKFTACHQALHCQASPTHVQQLQEVEQINPLDDSGYTCIPTPDILEYKNIYTNEGRVVIENKNKIWIK